jgi:HAD superfamily hydrolase (TIGR01662 family)
LRERAVTFDFGQVLAAFDPLFLAEKVRALGHAADGERLAEAEPAGWDAYGKSIRLRGHGEGAWQSFVATVLERGGASSAAIPEVLHALFLDQRERNLWRKPVPGMIEIVRELRAAGVPVGVVSNSEGFLARLVEQLGWTADFDVVADSGVLGMEKPSPAIFRWAAERLDVPLSSIVHVGDSWAADVEGALGAGARAIWFPALDERAAGDERVRAASTATDVRAALSSFGFPIAL